LGNGGLGYWAVIWFACPTYQASFYFNQCSMLSQLGSTDFLSAEDDVFFMIFKAPLALLRQEIQSFAFYPICAKSELGLSV
jgi:hypothetical protein